MDGVKAHYYLPVAADEKLQLHGTGGDVPSLGPVPATPPDADLEIVAGPDAAPGPPAAP
jgi:hypothetical protein